MLQHLASIASIRIFLKMYGWTMGTTIISQALRLHEKYSLSKDCVPITQQQMVPMYNGICNTMTYCICIQSEEYTTVYKYL